MSVCDKIFQMKIFGDMPSALTHNKQIVQNRVKISICIFYTISISFNFRFYRIDFIELYLLSNILKILTYLNYRYLTFICYF